MLTAKDEIQILLSKGCSEMTIRWCLDIRKHEYEKILNDGYVKLSTDKYSLLAGMIRIMKEIEARRQNNG